MSEILKVDIWSEGVRTIMSATKRSLLDYIDAIMKQTTNQTEKERLEKIKGRVHNDISSASLNVGILLATFRSGGDISAFEDDIVRKDRETKAKEKVEKLFSSDKNGS